MKLCFDPASDSGAWPGPLGGGEWRASAGEAWVGPLGFLGELELRLGLGRPSVSQAERIAALLGPVRRIEGFWSASAESDPISTAETLLRWRDILWRHGWRGEPFAPRLGALARVTGEAPPGIADRMAEVLDELDRRPPEIASVTVLEDPEELPRPWPEILRRLRRHGVRLERRSLPDSAGGESSEPVDQEPRGTEPAAAAPGDPVPRDLARARTADPGGFQPTGDGTLQLLRAHGPSACAEEVAAWLAAREDPSGTVLVTPDPTLDAALHRHGLPTSGAMDPERSENACFQILPLLLDLGWDPPDPQVAQRFLLLPLSPVRPSVGRRLVRALTKRPAVGSRAWERAVSEALEAIPEEDQRQKVRRRLDGIFRSPAPAGGRYPVPEARRRTELLTRWISARLAVTEHPSTGASLEAAWAHTRLFERLLEAHGGDSLSRPALQRLVELATADHATPSPFPAEAGWSVVADPAAIAAPARRIVWWNFTLGHAPSLEQIPLTGAERRALEAEGVRLPTPAEEAERTADRWRRPLRAAEESLLLVAPRVDASGEEAFPHPLWDEIATRGSAGTSGPWSPSSSGSLVGRWRATRSSRPSGA